MAGTSDTPLADVVLDDVLPEALDADEIRAALTSSRAHVRQRGARACERLVEADVDAVRPLVGELGHALTADNPGVVQSAASALYEVAVADVTAVEDVVERAASLAESDLAGVQVAGAQVLAVVGRERPAYCTSVVGVLVDALDEQLTVAGDDSIAESVDDRETRQTIRQHEQEEQQHASLARQLFANVVVAVAEATPTAVVDHVAGVADLLDHEDPVVRGAALDTLGAVGRERPAAVAPFTDAIVACLDADETVLRSRAIRTLGYVGATDAVAALEATAETDPHDEVAAFAAETAAFLRQ
ncbi:HEAT repeat domain-containing protein [Salinirubrum litoreum]|uniref:HEAT repeat domain-containing protein n=1 Tax=Salinirubrum litoreum TaxID=1126234 RepID=A0ABD5RFZ0_9EURY|nr:HEAT repeat domain-containing protein [Salinirubrum litoreum]